MNHPQIFTDSPRELSRADDNLSSGLLGVNPTKSRPHSIHAGRRLSKLPIIKLNVIGEIVRTYYVVDWTALSAIATAAAVFIALFQEPVRRKWREPKLRIGYRSLDRDKINISASPDLKRYAETYRLRVINRGREAAQRVEVVITDVYHIDEGSGAYERLPGFISTPLKWTHTDSAICEYLPTGERLCDLGVRKFSEHPSAPEVFTFTLSINPKTNYNRVSNGRYVMRLVASGLNCRPATVLLELKIGGPIPFILVSALPQTLKAIARIEESCSTKLIA